MTTMTTRRHSSSIRSSLLNAFLVVTFGVNLVLTQDATSLLSGFLSSFAESSTSPGCPGECRHALSALFCSYIEEDADCGDSKLRCCTDPPAEVAPSPTSPSNYDEVDDDGSSLHDDGHQPTNANDGKLNASSAGFADDVDPPDRGNRPTDGDHTFHRPPMLTQATPISVGANLTVRPTSSGQSDVGVLRPSQLQTSSSGSRRPLRRRTSTAATTATTTMTTTSSTASVDKSSSSSNVTSADIMVATMIPTPAALTSHRVKPSHEPAASGRLRPCHGICVTKTVALFCSAIAESGQCSPGEACCLTGGEDELEEPEMQVETMAAAAAASSSSSVSSSSSSTPSAASSSSVAAIRPATSAPSASMTMTTMKSFPATTGSTSSTTVAVIRKRRPPPTSTSSSTSRPPVIDNRHKHSPSASSQRPPSGNNDDDECAGSCILGLLSLLCDGVDSTVTCANGGQCCISKSRPNSDGSGDGAVESTPRPPIRKCPGICLPSMLTGVCNKPAVLVPDALDCDDGSVCCDNSLRETGHQAMPATTTTTTTAATPLMDLLSWPLKLAAASSGSGSGSGSDGGGISMSNINSALKIGSALSGLFGGGGGSGSGSGSASGTVTGGTDTAVVRPQTTFGNAGTGAGETMMMSSQSNPETIPPSSMVDRIQNGPECPGTCIASFLKMTCFGSSQVVESFLCPKDNLVCCAPKTALSGLNPDFMNNDNHWNHTANHLSAPTDSSAVVGYSQRPYNNNRYVCGMKGAVRPETPRVVGGRDASPGEWCWQVALINSLNQYLCGGALIGRQWVLTAAHCVTNLIRSGDAIYIRVGDYDLTSKYGSPGAQTLRVATTYIHHNHNSQTLDNNIALLKLEKLVDLKEGVCLVCLPARGVAVQPGNRCFVTGYGYMGESGPIPLRIRAAMLPVVSEQECVRKINAVTEKIFILPASSFCAGGEEGHDACQGDGGGPMSCEVDGYYEITGIVSWGFGCGRLDVPGIYVKVSSFIGWINQIISVNNI